jgi:hypothetical protein
MKASVSVVLLCAMTLGAPVLAQEEEAALPDLYAQPDRPGVPDLHHLRLELFGSAGIISGTDPSAIPAGGLTARIYASDTIALGIEGSWYGGYEDESRVPAYQAEGGRMGFGWQMLWVADTGPIGGAVYDVGLLFGSGILGSRAVPDDHASGTRLQATPYADFGLMMRVFLTRWLTTGVELRHDMIFYDGDVAPAFEARGGFGFWLPLQQGWDLQAGTEVASR